MDQTSIQQLINTLTELSKQAELLIARYFNETNYTDEGRPIADVMLETADALDDYTAQLARLGDYVEFIEPKKFQSRRLRWLAQLKGAINEVA
jgi:hypothetical protein